MIGLRSVYCSRPMPVPVVKLLFEPYGPPSSSCSSSNPPEGTHQPSTHTPPIIYPTVHPSITLHHTSSLLSPYHTQAPCTHQACTPQLKHTQTTDLSQFAGVFRGKRFSLFFFPLFSLLRYLKICTDFLHLFLSSLFCLALHLNRLFANVHLSIYPFLITYFSLSLLSLRPLHHKGDNRGLCSSSTLSPLNHSPFLLHAIEQPHT